MRFEHSFEPDSDPKHAGILDGHLVSDDGKYIIAAESGELLYWNLEERTVIFQVYYADHG